MGRLKANVNQLVICQENALVMHTLPLDSALFSFSIIGNPIEYDAATDWTINTNRLVAMSNWGDFQIGKFILDRSGTSSDYSGMKVIVSITK